MGEYMKFWDTPYMAKREIKILDDLFIKYRPEICLEWGAGGSTIYFPNKHKFIKQWVSIEHTIGYAHWIHDKIDQERVALLKVEKENYIDILKYQKQKYDFILIDGLFRGECLKESNYLLAEGGIAIMHDTGLKQHREHFNKFEGNMHELCEGEGRKYKDGTFLHRGLTMFWKK